VRILVTCKRIKTHEQVDFNFSFFFRSASVFSFFQICFTEYLSLVYVFFSFASGGRWYDQRVAGDWVSVASVQIDGDGLGSVG
jgi:hypothetical protein